MSAPSAMAANRRSASSMGADRSASVNITISPSALQDPGAYAVAFAAISGVFKQPNLGRMHGKVPYQVGRGVGESRR